MKPLAVVLASGGMDSCVSAAIAAESHELAFLHVCYGQKTEAREEQAFRHIAAHFGSERILVTHMDHLKAIGGSSLTSNDLKIADADLNFKGVPNTYVPFRNAHLLCMATSWAEVIGAEAVFIGAVEEDSSGYPDCTQSFIEAFNGVVEKGTKPETQIKIVAPLIQLNKAQIIKRGLSLKAPLDLTWSCYRNSRKACGKCDSCALRLRGFMQAGCRDPIEYEA
ncbi:MAG: 7-cyano-7-deazaguanine synthase QueC [Acidobacteria bacterium]|nr:MAG: 7-cyano-7-deazaguanine synthase QueC [Acidobacteriota bacterium]